MASSIKTVLLLEDNMLIALDAENALNDAGIDRVLLASNCEAALAHIENEAPDFALLDFNLGDETSERVADALTASGVPFCYATGYGEAMQELANPPPCGVLKKPYSKDEIVAMLAKAGHGCR